MLRWCLAVLVVSICLWPAAANADTPRVDWQRGLLIGRGAAVGDLRSPTRQLARVKAARQARQRARAGLLEAARSVPIAGPESELDEERLATISEGLLETRTDFGSDGSVVVEMALPLDALRSLLYSSDEPVTGPLEGPKAVIVDARARRLKPAIGYVLEDGTTSYRGPSVFFGSEKEAREDARVGKDATLVVASGVVSTGPRAGTLRIKTETLATLVGARPLVVILWNEER